MDCFIAWLDRWQELIGAAVGALGGLVAALIVARAADRRVERSAGVLLTSKLISLISACKKISANNATDDHIAKELTERFPIDDSSFESLFASVGQIDNYLAALLTLIQIRLHSMKEARNRLKDALKNPTTGGQFDAAARLCPRDVQIMAIGARSLITLADFATTLIGKLVLRKVIRNRLRRHFGRWSPQWYKDAVKATQA